eukprot:1041534-Pyramimonas_sp.AAC.1
MLIARGQCSARIEIFASHLPPSEALMTSFRPTSALPLNSSRRDVAQRKISKRSRITFDSDWARV